MAVPLPNLTLNGGDATGAPTRGGYTGEFNPVFGNKVDKDYLLQGVLAFGAFFLAYKYLKKGR